MQQENARHSTTNINQARKHYWGVTLAGGEGRRLQPFIKAQYGHNLPKQYCAILGTRSMLKHTLDRAEQVICRQQVLTVINRQHFSYAMDDLRHYPSQNIIIQPFSRETGPGILLPLLHIYHRDPEAIVAIFPSDHFILEEDRFMGFVDDAFTFVQNSCPGHIVTLGIEPDQLQTGYGWIEKGAVLSNSSSRKLYEVHRFWEKPDIETTQLLHDNGCLWNTLTLVGRVGVFMNLFRKFMPEVYRPFQRISDALGTSHDQEVVDDIFGTIPTVNFSRSILERAPEYLGVLPVSGVYWSDWGDEHRIRADISRFGYRKAIRPVAATTDVPTHILASEPQVFEQVLAAGK